MQNSAFFSGRCAPARRSGAWLALAITVFSVSACGGGDDHDGMPAPTPSPYLGAKAGDVLKVSIEQLHPTQAVVGYDQIYYHLGRKQPDPGRFAPTAAGYLGNDDTDNYSRYVYRTEYKRADDYCADNGQTGVDAGTFKPGTVRLIDPTSFRCADAAPVAGSTGAAELKTVVVGPAGTLYLTDGHHTFTALNELADGGPKLPVWVRVSANFSDAATTQAFWQRMSESGYTWLRDAAGKTITPAELPQKVALASFQDDAYRSLVYLTRDMGYDNAEVSEFAEFHWGNWLRASGVDLAAYQLRNLERSRIAITGGVAAARDGDSKTSYVAAVRDAALRMVALDDTVMVGGSRTAAQLGKLPAPTSAGTWNDLLEEEVWRADTNSSGRYRTAGKAWYAVKYRECGGPASIKPACWLPAVQ